MVKKNNSSKKTGNAKTGNAKTIIIVVFCATLSLSVLSMTLIFNSETTASLTKTTPTMSDYVENHINTHTYFTPQNDSYFDHFLTKNDYIRYQNGNNLPNDGIRLTFNDLYEEQLKKNKPWEN